MSDTPTNDAPQILIEFPQKAGIQQVSLTPQAVGEKSAKAMEAAMQAIKHMADKVATAVQGIAKKPSEVEVSFGLKFDVESGVLIAKTNMEAGLDVTLKWDLKEEKK